MAKRDNPIQKVTPHMDLPAHLRGREVEGVETLKQYVVMPRLKIVQKQAAAALLDTFGVGDCIMSPTQTMLVPNALDDGGKPAKVGPSFYFTPVFFFVDWATWNPIETKGQAPAIAYRTSDPTDPIVAKSRDPQLRLEPYMQNGKQVKSLNVRHVEHLNFIVRLHGHPITDAFIMTFARGEHFGGQRFCGLIRQRNASLFGCVFEGHVQHRVGEAGDWYGIDVSNPSVDSGVGPWCTKEQYAVFEADYKNMAAVYKTQGIQADLSDVEDLQEGATPTGQREM